ncbi:MAG TPA: outer membrane beta-barrel protein [Woeseiaceae bacterium]|nr:outer membrane beta-barrel protein [Woeseiaceae bacterium]
MRKAIAASVLLVALAAAPAFADKGFSAGASLGYSNVSIEESGASVDFNDVGYKIFGAYMFNDNWGIEGGWMDMGSMSEDVFGTEFELEVDGIDLFVVGSMPVSETFDLFGKAGMVSWDAKFSASGFGSGSDSGEDIAVGLGGRFNTSGGFGFRGEFEWFDIEDIDSAWLFSVGFEYSFK